LSNWFNSTEWLVIALSMFLSKVTVYNKEINSMDFKPLTRGFLRNDFII